MPSPRASPRSRREARRPGGVPRRRAGRGARRAASAPLPGRERVDSPFVTIDPPGARDLDQAMHIGAHGDGVPRSLRDRRPRLCSSSPAGRWTATRTTRAVTVYAPDRKVPLHPPVLSEGAASLLPGEWRPAVLWTLDLDAARRADPHGGRRASAGAQRLPAHLRGRAGVACAAAARGGRAAAGDRARARRRAARGARAGGRPGRRRLDGALPRRRWRAKITTPRSRCSPAWPRPR